MHGVAKIIVCVLVFASVAMATGESAVGESDFYEAFDAGKPLSDDEDIVSDVSVLLGAEDKGFFSRVSKVVKSAAKKVAKKGAKAKKFVKATMKKALKGLLNKGKGGKKHIGGAYEKLTRVMLLMPGSTVALKGGRGNKWCADEGAKVMCNRGHIKSWEKFTVVDAGKGKVALRGGRNGKYCADEGKGIKCNRSKLLSWEMFSVIDAGAGKIALKGGKDGKYCADDTKEMKCNRGHLKSWEKFTVKCLAGCSAKLAEKEALAKNLKAGGNGKTLKAKSKSAVAGKEVAKLEGGMDGKMDRKYGGRRGKWKNPKGKVVPFSKKYDNGKIKPPGYVASDASIDKSTGRYRLGANRRRIGAGFGRRRAPVVLSHHKKKKVKKELAKSPITAPFHKAARRRAPARKLKKKIIRKIKKKMPVKVKKKFVKVFTKKVITGVAKFGSRKGVTFYKHCVKDSRFKAGYRRTVKAKGVGMTKISFVTKAGLLNNDISAVSVPPGWCTKVYQLANFKGRSKLITGPRNISCLTKHKMNAASTWNDQISSLKVWECGKEKPPVFPYKGAFCKTTYVRYTTGMARHANSHMSPKIALMGTNGAAVGVLKKLPKKGHTMMTVIKTANIGEIQSLRLLATSRDSWYFTGFSVKSCQPGSKWISFGCTHLWLDGKKISKKKKTKLADAGRSKRANRLTLYRGRMGPCEVDEPKAIFHVTTGFVEHAESRMRPRVTLIGTKGTFTGRIKVSSSKRVTEETTLKTKKDIGDVKRVVLEAVGRDGWQFEKFAVKTWRWQHFGCTKRWLDGKPYDKSPYGMPYSNKIVLHPINKDCHAHFPKSWKKTKRGCVCSNAKKYGKCAKYKSKKTWCKTKDHCGRTSHKYGKWDWC